MIQFNAVEFAPGVTGEAEVRQRLCDALGQPVLRRAVFLYEQHFRAPRWFNGRLEWGGIPSPSEIVSVENALDRLIRDKKIRPDDLVVLDCEYTPVEWNTAPEAQRQAWREHRQSSGSTWTERVMARFDAFNRVSFNDACIEMYRRAWMAAGAFKSEAAYYDLCPSEGWRGHVEEAQRKRWAAIPGRHTQSIYPRKLDGVMDAFGKNVSLLEEWRRPTLIQSPIYQDVAGAIAGQPLSSLDVARTISMASLAKCDLIWWLPVFTQDQSDALRCSGVFEAMKRAQERIEGKKGVEPA